MTPYESYYQAREETKETGLEGHHKTFDRAVDILCENNWHYADALVEMEDYVSNI